MRATDPCDDDMLAGVSLVTLMAAHSLAPFFPEDAADLDTTRWASGLASAGLREARRDTSCAPPAQRYSGCPRA